MPLYCLRLPTRSFNLRSALTQHVLFLQGRLLPQGRQDYDPGEVDAARGVPGRRLHHQDRCLVSGHADEVVTSTGVV